VIDYIGMCAIVGGGLNLDLVISDIHMAGADGLRILSGLHSHDPRLPVILITAYGNPEVEAEAMRRGALAVLEKPFDVDQLLALLRQRLQREQPAPPS
jgi:two-component system C4-dicarboxylate transport response regulator DctD